MQQAEQEGMVLTVEIKCKEHGCDTEAKVRGYCIYHYGYYRNRYNGFTPRETVVNKGVTCKIKGCDNKSKSKHYCNKHYMHLYRHGGTFTEVEIEEKKRKQKYTKKIKA